MITSLLLRSAKLVLGLAFALLAGAPASAQTVTLDFAAGRLYDSGGTLLPDNTLVIFVADTQQNGFGTLSAPGTLNIGDFLNGDNQILARGTVNAFFGTGTAGGSTGALALASGAFAQLTTNDPLAVLWFPGLTDGSFSFTSGSSYGLFGAADWFVPTAGSTQSFQFFTVARGGTEAETQGYAAATAVPEPAALALVMGCVVLGLASGWRRGMRGRWSGP